MESSNGAKASAMIYSIVETANANQMNVYQYLELLLTEIPKHIDNKNIRFNDDLLPWSPTIQEKCPSKYKKSQLFKVQKSISNNYRPYRNAGFSFCLVLMNEYLQALRE